MNIDMHLCVCAARLILACALSVPNAKKKKEKNPTLNMSALGA